jgi:hypothetical protein
MSSDTVSNLHNWHHENYESAKAQIYHQIGDIGDLEVFGQQVIVAVYIRPNFTAGGLIAGTKMQKEDIYQGKVVLILKCGPDAFQGDESYAKAMFGDAPPPTVGDWVFLRSQDGTPISMQGEGAARVKVPDRRGDPMDVYDWDGWPCRIVKDDDIIGRAARPHSIV